METYMLHSQMVLERNFGALDQCSQLFKRIAEEMRCIADGVESDDFWESVEYLLSWFLKNEADVKQIIERAKSCRP